MANIRKVKGRVAKVYVKTGVKKDGTPWSLYSVKVDDDWYGLGFLDEPPAFAENDVVEFSAREDERNKGRYVAVDPVVVIAAPVPAASAPEKAGPSSRPAACAEEENAAPATMPWKERRIVWQHSQEIAVRTAVALLDHKALPVSVADSKAGAGKRFEEIVAAIDKLTVKFYNDANTLRLLQTVNDFAVVDKSPDGPIPEMRSSAAPVSEKDENSDYDDLADVPF